jgi:hypothetical protein
MNDRDIGYRSASPPAKYAEVAHCPECGCDEIGEILIEKTYNRVTAWYDKLPEQYDLEDSEVVDYADPRYYCCYCGDEFNTPDWRWEEVA